ncbi:MAG TPA: TatD family hydrolase [Candidatus Binatia bacterium]|jgi:TatD DNase family protein|nr:TatD family hydrolase [Candidatus Binatia bacterium]
MGLADVHAHLTHPRLAPDADAIVARARAAGVTTIVSNGLNPADNAAVLALAARHPMVRPGLGFYPVDAVMNELLALDVDYPRDVEPVTADEGVGWVEAHVEQAFAIGEIGLDGHWVPEALWARQEEVFRRMVALAMAADKPIIVHTRKRERRTFEILQELGATRVNWHCFGGKVALARTIAEHGHWFSIPANARRSESFTRMLETLPRDRLLLETDCPYLGPERDQTNEPANVAGTAAYAAALWETSPEDVTERMADNFLRLFRTSP